jgi:hypothetical protein
LGAEKKGNEIFQLFLSSADVPTFQTLDDFFSSGIFFQLKNFFFFVVFIRKKVRKQSKAGKKFKNGGCKQGDQGSMLRSKCSAIFANFRRKKLAFFSKTNVMIKFFNNLALFSSKMPFFHRFFGDNIFKNNNNIRRLCDLSAIGDCLLWAVFI